MFTNTYLVCSMEPGWYDYEQQHAIREDEHDYEDEIDGYPEDDEYYEQDPYEYSEGFTEREDLGWDGQLED